MIKIRILLQLYINCSLIRTLFGSSIFERHYRNTVCYNSGLCFLLTIFQGYFSGSTQEPPTSRTPDHLSATSPASTSFSPMSKLWRVEVRNWLRNNSGIEKLNSRYRKDLGTKLRVEVLNWGRATGLEVT